MSNRNIIGLLLILLGGGILLDQLEIINFGDWWPILIILAGVYVTVARQVPLFGGVLILVVGLLLQASQLDWLPGGFWGSFWPVFIIIMGLWLILPQALRTGGEESADDKLSHFAAFTGSEWRHKSSQFQGGSVVVLFGSGEVDLRGSSLAEEGAHLELTSAFGGIKMFVPETWHVQVSGLPLFGGFDNKLPASEKPKAGAPVLQVRYLSAFGGIELTT